MDLGSPLRSLIPSLDSATLDVLLGTESWLSAGDIARIARRGTRQGHLLVLHRLVEHGLVTAEPIGRGYRYRLNRAHLLAESLVIAANAREVLRNRLVEGVSVLRPVHASIFGSLARGEANESSDIDVLVVLPGSRALDDADAEALRDLGERVLSWTGNRLQSVVLNEHDLRASADAGEAIVDSWLDDAVTLVGRPLVDVLARK